MLEKACMAVEEAAKGGGVYPEVLFEVAHQLLAVRKQWVEALGPRERGPAAVGPMVEQEERHPRESVVSWITRESWTLQVLQL